MKTIRLLLFFCAIFISNLSIQTVGAQEEEEEPTSSVRSRLYSVKLPGGEYTVDLSRITSVSLHKFYVDGAFSVQEVTVDTTGQTVARFYFVERNKDVSAPRGIGQSLVDRAQNKLDEAKDRAGVTTPLDDAVVKSYPTTTHAHTVEYRITSQEQLESLYKDIKTRWQRYQ